MQHGGNPATWTKFVRFAGGWGHPQLVHVVVAGLAERSWPESELVTWFTDGFNNQDVAIERSAARRRLLQELDDREVTLLARLARVTGEFDSAMMEAVASISPPVQSAKLVVDRLSGHWIERVGDRRFRVSPLIADLPGHLLTTKEQAETDTAIGRSIVFRNPLEGDLLDTGFMHALLGKDDATLTRLAMALAQAEDHVVTQLSGAMPIFRTYLGGAGGSAYRPPPGTLVLLSIARHRLLLARRDRRELNESVLNILSLVDLVDGDGVSVPTRFMAIAQVLHPQQSLGMIDNWFELLRELDSNHSELEEVQEVFAGTTAELGIDPIGFLFVAHAIHLPTLDDLAALFRSLAVLETVERKRWLQALGHVRSWSMLVVDNAWLKAQQNGTLDWKQAADVYADLGETALSWSEIDIAARCFRNQSVLIDEYGKDSAAALAAIDQAETR